MIITAPTGEEISSSVNQSWPIALIAIVTIAISLGTNFWLYYQRVTLLRDGPALVPEKWGVLINHLAISVAELNEQASAASKSAGMALENNLAKADSLLESFLTLQTAISQRDKEILRLRSGHDAKVFKRFLNSFIRVSTVLHEIAEEEKQSDQAKNYRYLCKRMVHALEDAGVELLTIEENKDYRELGPEVDDDPEIIETSDPQLDFIVQSTVTPAYVIEGEGDLQVLIPAKVRIYRTLEEQGNTE